MVTTTLLKHRQICSMLLVLFSRTIITIHVCVKCAFCGSSKVSVLPIGVSIIHLGRGRARDTSQRGRNVHSTSFAGAWGEQRVLWMEPGCGEPLALLQRETGRYLICCWWIVVGEGRFSARGVSPRKRSYPQGAMVSTGQCGQSSCSHIWETLLSSCIQQCYCQFVPVEVRQKTKHIFKVLCFSECCECKEVVLRLLATYTYSRN